MNGFQVINFGQCKYCKTKGVYVNKSGICEPCYILPNTDNIPRRNAAMARLTWFILGQIKNMIEQEK